MHAHVLEQCYRARAFIFTGAVAVIALLGAAGPLAPLGAQHVGGAQTMATRAPAEASQFDFLVGEWDLVVEPQVSTLAARLHGAPRLQGAWKAWRVLDGWGIEDELRIVDEAGNPRALTLFVRVWDVGTGRWRISAVEAYTAAQSQSVGALREAMEVAAVAPGSDRDGRTFAARSRFVDVTPSSFTYVQERSYDGGREWETTVRILATRIAEAAPR